MTAIVDKAKADGNRSLTSAERETFHATETDYSNIEDSIKIAEKSQTIFDHLAKAAPGTVIADVQTEELQDTLRLKHKVDNSPRGKAFANYIRNGEHTAPEDRKLLRVQNAQSTTPGSAGGFVVAPLFADQLDVATKWFGSLDGTVGKLTTSTGANLAYPTVNDTMNKGSFLGINVAATEKDLTFGQVNFASYQACSNYVLIPKALIQDSYFDLQELLTRLLGIRMGRLKNNACTVGTGGGVMPTGIVTASVAAGNLVTFPTGETTTISYNNLVDIEGAVDPSYRTNSQWMFSDNVLKVLKKLVDDNGRPLWQPAIMSSFREGAGVTAGEMKPLILDHPYQINSDMGSEGANGDTILLGDISKFYIREIDGAKELITLVERFAEFNQVAYLCWDRYDSNLVDSGTHPVAVGVQSAT